jgi:hypothetical protein
MVCTNIFWCVNVVDENAFNTGPMLASGSELATAASQALGVKMEYENITQCVS